MVMKGSIQMNFEEEPSLKVEVLKLLGYHLQSGGVPLLTLMALSAEFGEPADLVKQACDSLEKEGFIKGFAFGKNGKEDPSYDITKVGVNMLFSFNEKHIPQ
ncbi:MAG: hypothetical protein EXR59_06205 [Dehalococcoidia bacterium]|nr:hypothetical protein [Dehalococcoidia bacterium]